MTPPLHDIAITRRLRHFAADAATPPHTPPFLSRDAIYLPLKRCTPRDRPIARPLCFAAAIRADVFIAPCRFSHGRRHLAAYAAMRRLSPPPLHYDADGDDCQASRHTPPG